jgi:hypothetical protein
MDLYARVVSGETMAAVGKDIGATRQSISLICHKMDNYLLPIHMDRVRALKSEHTEKLTHIYCEAMAEWRRSKQNAEMVSEKLKTNGEEKTETTKTTKGQCGDARYLEAAMKALQDIRKIWGADAPIEMRFMGELRVAGKPIEEANRELLEEIERVKTKLLTPGEN